MKIYKLENQCCTPYPVGLYVDQAFGFIENLHTTIKANNIFKKNSDIFIWCRGSSGSILASMLTQKLISNGYNIHICYVRKDNENSHSPSSYGWFIDCHENACHMIIDDIVETGHTLREILQVMYVHGIKKLDVLAISCVNVMPGIGTIPQPEIIRPKVFIAGMDKTYGLSDDVLNMKIKESEKLHAQSIKGFLNK